MLGSSKPATGVHTQHWEVVNENKSWLVTFCYHLLHEISLLDQSKICQLKKCIRLLLVCAGVKANLYALHAAKTNVLIAIIQVAGNGVAATSGVNTTFP